MSTLMQVAYARGHPHVFSHVWYQQWFVSPTGRFIIKCRSHKRDSFCWSDEWGLHASVSILSMIVLCSHACHRHFQFVLINTKQKMALAINEHSSSSYFGLHHSQIMCINGRPPDAISRSWDTPEYVTRTCDIPTLFFSFFKGYRYFIISSWVSQRNKTRHTWQDPIKTCPIIMLFCVCNWNVCLCTWRFTGYLCM